MVPIEWIIFLIAFVASLLKAIWEGKAAKTSILFIILLTIIGAILGLIFGFIDTFLTATTFTITQQQLITYIFDSFIGAVIIPIAQYLISIKLE